MERFNHFLGELKSAIMRRRAADLAGGPQPLREGVALGGFAPAIAIGQEEGRDQVVFPGFGFPRIKVCITQVGLDAEIPDAIHEFGGFGAAVLRFRVDIANGGIRVPGFDSQAFDNG